MVKNSNSINIEKLLNQLINIAKLLEENFENEELKEIYFNQLKKILSKSKKIENEMLSNELTRIYVSYKKKDLISIKLVNIQITKMLFDFFLERVMYNDNNFTSSVVEMAFLLV